MRDISFADYLASEFKWKEKQRRRRMKYDTIRIYEWRYYELIDSEKRCNKLEQALDKIRAEIQHEADNNADAVSMKAYYRCLQIIDRYREGEQP